MERIRMKVIKEWIVLIFIISQTSSLEFKLFFEIKEEQPVGKIIHDLKDIFFYNISLQKLKINTKSLKFDFTTSLSRNEKYFALHPSSGVLTVAERLDRDELCKPRGPIPRCVFNIIANVRQDNNLHFFKISISLLDINDNEPKFEQNKISIEISDDTRERFAYNIPTATDADSDMFGIDRYSLDENLSDKIFLDVFELKTSKHQDGSIEVKLIVKKKLSPDNKSASQAMGYIIAFDKGKPSLSDVLEVTVTIIMTKDIAPKFEKSSYHFYVDENTPVDTKIHQIKASSTDNSTIDYYIQNDAPNYRLLPFRIDFSKGYLIVNGSLDYEKETYYLFVVVATTYSKSSALSKVQVSISINDLNDNAPQIFVDNINKNVKASILENSPIGTFISYISVTDKDSGDNKETSCIAQSNHFKLEYFGNSEYKLLSAEVFDREKMSNYEVKIFCEDKGSPVLTSEVILAINVIDINDNAPMFAQNIYNVDVYENSRLTNKPIFHINATDLDEHLNAQLSYSILPLLPSYANCLNIDILEGSIYLKCIFDYETDEQQQSYLISAIDSGSPKLTGSTTLLLNVIDVNDNIPTFTQEVYVFDVLRENLLENMQIGSVNATDADLTISNNKITYSLDGDYYEDVFNIDPFTGDISWKHPVYNESEFNFNITSSNSFSSITLSSTASIVINVEFPSNIKLMNYLKSDEKLFYEGPLKIGDPIYTFTFNTNSNLLSKKRLTIKIISGNEQNLFTVDNNNRQLIVASPLKYGLSEHNLTIEITDSNYNYRQTTIHLPIIINNTSNFLPAFDAWTRNPDNLLTIVCAGIGLVIFVLFVFSVIAIRKKHVKKKSKIICKTTNHDCDSISNSKEFKIVPNLYNSESLTKNINNNNKQSDMDRRKEVKFSLVHLDDHEAQQVDLFHHNINNLYKGYPETPYDPWVASLKKPHNCFGLEEDTSLTDSGKGTSDEGDHVISMKIKDHKYFMHPDHFISENLSNAMKQREKRLSNQNVRFNPTCLSKCEHLSPIGRLEMPLQYDMLTFKPTADENCELCLMDQRLATNWTNQKEATSSTITSVSTTV